MEKNTGGSFSDLVKDMYCSICFQRPINATIISCGHLFCLECLKKWMCTNFPDVTCPKCKLWFDMKEAITYNRPNNKITMKNLKTIQQIKRIRARCITKHGNIELYEATIDNSSHLRHRFFILIIVYVIWIFVSRYI